MKVRKHLFTLNKLCPICGQGSALALVTCSACGQVMVECVEEGTIFNVAEGSNQLQAVGTDALCSKCREVPLIDFRPSTGEEIQAAGFKVSEYK